MVALGLNNVAFALKKLHRADKAEPLYRQALAIDRATYGEQHKDVATDLNNLAQLYILQQKPQEVRTPTAKTSSCWHMPPHTVKGETAPCNVSGTLAR